MKRRVEVGAPWARSEREGEEEKKRERCREVKDQPSYPSCLRTATLLIVEIRDVKRVSQSKRQTHTHGDAHT